MADQTKSTLIYAGVAFAVIAFANMGGTFSSSSDPAAAVQPTLLAGPPAGVAPPVRTERTVTTRAGEPSIITYKSGEQKIEQSIADARAKLDYFWQHANSPAPGERSFTLKVAFPVEKNGEKGREHIWVMDVKRQGGAIMGRLDNDPDLMKGFQSGDTVSFTDDMVTDWGFARRGKMIGFYSTRVMLEDAPPAEAAKIRAALGENPA